jgi:Cys-rich protein (TIGR01571 family)
MSGPVYSQVPSNAPPQQYATAYATPVGQQQQPGSGVEGQAYGYVQQQQQPYQTTQPTYVQVPGQPIPQQVQASGQYQPGPGAVAVPVGYVGQITPGGVAQGRIPYGVWSDGVCDCLSHCESCLVTYFLMPFRWAKTVERSRLNTFAMAMALYGLPWLLMIIFFFVNWSTVSVDTTYNHRDTTEDVNYFGWAIWLCFAANFFMIWLGVVYRQKLRTMYHIPGSGMEDCLLHTFCRFCAVAQEARHVDRDSGLMFV